MHLPRFLTITAMFLAIGCQRTLLPTPNIYLDGATDPLVETATAYRTTAPTLLCVLAD